MRSRSVRLHRGTLPQIPIYVLVSVVPDSFGGLTTAALQRSSAFADVGRRRIDVLTKSDAMSDPAVRTRELRRAGRISSGVRIRNVWFELLSLSEQRLAQLGRSEETSASPDGEQARSDDPSTTPDQRSDDEPSPERTQEGEPASGHSVATREGEDGSVLQKDHLRADGTCAISDRRDVGSVAGGRLITLRARSGRPVVQWHSLKEMYHWWVDRVIGDEEAILIIDSAPTGGLFHDYQRPNVTTVHCLHTHHLRQMHRDVRDKTTADVMRLLTHLDWFDAVAVLTREQLVDLRNSGIVGDNGVVLPNVLVDPPAGGVNGHERSRGAIIGRQASVKRLDHALRAMAIARSAAPDLHLDMYGHGQQSGKLIRLGEDLGLADHITQHGYDPRGKEAFARASFTLMCSKYEGFGLTLVEAMAAGCIPIAYDIEYGPRDIITEGIDGMIVPDGDVDALASAIVALRTMDEDTIGRMRAAAISRARDFSPTSIVRRWGRELDAARRRHEAARPTRIEARVIELDPVPHGLRIVVDVEGEGTEHPRRASIGWRGRARETFRRSTARISRRGAGLRLEGEIDARTLADVEAGAILDVLVDIEGHGTLSRSRVATRSFDLVEVDSGEESDAMTTFRPYSTKGGNLSLRML